MALSCLWWALLITCLGVPGAYQVHTWYYCRSDCHKHVVQCAWSVDVSREWNWMLLIPVNLLCSGSIWIFICIFICICICICCICNCICIYIWICILLCIVIVFACVVKSLSRFQSLKHLRFCSQVTGYTGIQVIHDIQCARVGGYTMCWKICIVFNSIQDGYNVCTICPRFSLTQLRIYRIYNVFNPSWRIYNVCVKQNASDEICVLQITVEGQNILKSSKQ